MKTVFSVEGMMCHNCEKHVNEAIKKAFKVKSVDSDHKKNETVVISKEELNAEAVKAVIEEQGYKVTGFVSEN